jgi:hypothetical protein
MKTDWRLITLQIVAYRAKCSRIIQMDASPFKSLNEPKVLGSFRSNTERFRCQKIQLDQQQALALGKVQQKSALNCPWIQRNCPGLLRV